LDICVLRGLKKLCGVCRAWGYDSRIGIYLVTSGIYSAMAACRVFLWWSVREFLTYREYGRVLLSVLSSAGGAAHLFDEKMGAPAPRRHACLTLDLAQRRE
jgi:hypothetical protein